MSGQSTFKPVLRTARSRMTRRDQRGFYADLEDAGLRPDVTTDIDPARPAQTDVAELLGVAAQTPVLARQRRMSTNGTALQLATTYFAPSIVAEVPQLGEQNTGTGGNVLPHGKCWVVPKAGESERPHPTASPSS